MEGAWLARVRWRRRGAWMWPTFLATIAVDAVIGHFLPPAGTSQTALGAALLGTFLNLFAVILASWPAGWVIRRRRADLPAAIARDYGGTAAFIAISAALLTAGLIHRQTINHNERAKRDAIVRAQAWIGARAPDEFRRNLSVVDTYAIEPGHMYRICVPDAHWVRTFCVIVDSRLPFDRSVRFAGYEPNRSFAAGAD